MDHGEAVGLEALASAMDKANVGNFKGVKYTGLYTYPGFMDVSRILNFKGGKYEVLCGRDEMMIEAITSGITGFVGSQYNMVGDLYNEIRAKMAAGDVEGARALQFAPRPAQQLRDAKLTVGSRG